MKYMLWVLEAIAMFFDFIIPRFVTDVVALYKNPDGDWVIVGVLDYVDPSVYYEATGIVKAFNIFGFGFFAKLYVESIVYKNIVNINVGSGE